MSAAVRPGRLTHRWGNEPTALTPTPARPASREPLLRSAPPSDAKWDLLLCCVAGYLLTSVGRVHQLFPALDALRPTMLSGLLAIVTYLIHRVERRRAQLPRVSTTKYLVAFLVWMILSIPGALVRSTSVDLVAGNFVKTVLMYVIILGAVRGTRDIERLSAVYLVAATVYAGVVISRFDVGGGDDWRLGRLYYYDANDFATFAVTAMPLGLYYLLQGRRRVSLRVLAAFSLAVLALAFVRSGSRGGFIALIAVAGFVVLRYRGIPLRWRIGATAFVTLVVLVTASEQYWKQMGTILSDVDYNRTEESGRMHIWSRGVGYMLEYPIFGVGPNNFQVAEGMLSPMASRQQFGKGVRWNAAHNSYIQVGAELGFPGLVMFVAIIASAFAALRAARRSDDARPESSPHLQALAQALSASLIGFVVGAFFLSLAYTEMLYVLVSLAASTQRVAAPMRPATASPAPFPTRVRREPSVPARRPDDPTPR